MQQQIKPARLVDLDGIERPIAELVTKYDLTKQAIYRRSEVRDDGRRYFRERRRPGWRKGVKRKEAA